MAKYIIDSETLQGLANALRQVTGEDRTYTPTEMIEAVSTILEKGAYILVDENGVEIPAVFVDNETVFTATANDIRIGTTAVTEAGVTEGTKEIPSYISREGYRLITNGSRVVLAIDGYDYTKFQGIICSFNTSLMNSVAAVKIAINDNVYPVNSVTAESSIVKDLNNERIDFGITNNSGKSYLLRYFTFKEEY